MGICFFVALLFTYITGGLTNLAERVVSKNIEKTIQRTTAEFAERKFSPEALKGLGKNQEDYAKHLSRDDLEKKKDYYKDKYKEMLQR
jgi:hypothetical protein